MMDFTALGTLKGKIEAKLHGTRLEFLTKWITAPFFWIFLLVFIFFLFGESVFYVLQGDTVSYLTSYQDKNIFRGELHAWRTPVYPYILRGLSFLTGEKMVVGGTLEFPTCSGMFTVRSLILLQFFAFLGGLWLFYRACGKIMKNSTILFGTVLLAGIGLMQNTRWISTESLGITFTMIFFSMMVFYLRDPSHKIAIGVNLLSCFMVFLRPVFLYLVLLLVPFWLLRMALGNSRKSAMTGFCFCLLTFLLLGGYCKLNEQRNGFFGIASVATHNQMACIIERGFYKNGASPEINEFIAQLPNDDSLLHGPMISEVLKYWSYEEVQQYTQATIKKNFVSYVIMSLKVMWWGKWEAMWVQCYALGFLDLLFTLALGVIFRQLPWIRLTTWGIFYGLIAVIYMGTTCDYIRLVTPALPVIYVLAGRYLDLLSVARSSSPEAFVAYLKTTL
ncbi:MAG: hypothetical protein Q4D98_11550 [Planctomycetia bacterium]|nr:hypothetical protein [Planctomycetia bacterium]